MFDVKVVNVNSKGLNNFSPTPDKIIFNHRESYAVISFLHRRDALQAVENIEKAQRIDYMNRESMKKATQRDIVKRCLLYSDAFDDMSEASDLKLL